jgi:hypothetical protein
MSEKRIECSFGGGSDTPILDLQQGILYSYELNRAELHNKFGGMQYYSSRSGLSGAGFIPLTNTNSLVKFGWYRTDIFRYEQHRELITDNIWGYAPIKSHGGIDHTKPVVLTDGTKVAFVNESEIVSVLADWNNFYSYEINFEYFLTDGIERNNSFLFYNPHKFRGVNPLRFIDLSDLQIEQYEHVGDSLHAKLSIVKTEAGYFHLNKLGYYDQFFKEDPHILSGVEINGFSLLGDGFIVRREGNSMNVFMEIDRDQTEQKISIFQWFSKSIEEWKAYFLSSIKEEKK